MKFAYLALLLFISQQLYAQKLVDFSVSVCKSDSIEGSEVYYVYPQSDGSTIIKFRSYANCNRNFEADVEFRDGLLNFIISLKYTRIYRKDGTYVEVLEVAECDCLFEFTFRIQGIIPFHSRNFLVNSLTFEEIDKKYVIIYDEFGEITN